METITVNSQNVKNKASYVMIFLSAFGIGYSVIKYFIQLETEVKWTTILPLFIISVIVFSKNMISLKK